MTIDAAEQTRDEHLAHCKALAIEALDDTTPALKSERLGNAVVTMLTELAKHPGNRLSAASIIPRVGQLYATQHDEAGVRRWIHGFR